MARTILELPLDHVIPDEDQVRRYLDDGVGLRPLRDAIERWGQLHPIRVRPDDGKFVIVDGERRWRALRQLRDQARKTRPGETSFDHVQAIVGAELDEDPQRRKAIQVVSNMGADLLPFEKARVVAELREAARESGEKLRHEEIAKMLGISRGQVRYLFELSKAPEFILEFGKPRTFQVVKQSDGEDLEEDGNVLTETIRREALTTPFLRQLHITFKKLADEDRQKLSDNPEHVPRAVRTVRQLGVRAQREQWTLRELTAQAERGVGAKRRRRPEEKASTGRKLQDLTALAERFLGDGLSELPEDQRIAAAKILRRVYDRLVAAQ